MSDFEKSLAVMGNEVEELARGMFPNGYLIERRSEGVWSCQRKYDPVPVSVFDDEE